VTKRFDLVKYARNNQVSFYLDSGANLELISGSRNGNSYSYKLLTDITQEFVLSLLRSDLNIINHEYDLLTSETQHEISRVGFYIALGMGFVIPPLAPFVMGSFAVYNFVNGAKTTYLAMQSNRLTEQINQVSSMDMKVWKSYVSSVKPEIETVEIQFHKI